MLLGNGSVLHKSPLKFLGGSTTSVEPQLGSNFQKTGFRRNVMYGDQRTTVLSLYARPPGYCGGTSWFIPQKSGDMSSHSMTEVSIRSGGTIVGGITTTGSLSLSLNFGSAQALPLDDSSPIRTGTSSISINFANANGQLITSAVGNAGFGFTSTSTLTASIQGIGGSVFSISSMGQLGAIVSGSGSTSMVFTINPAQAYPLNDTSPARTGIANFSIGGYLLPYAIGNMSGDTMDTSILTTQAITNDILNASASSFSVPGTIGSKINSSASGGVDIVALADAVLTALNATTIPVNVEKMNNANVIGTGTLGDAWRGTNVPP